jgi:hypothetical protein
MHTLKPIWLIGNVAFSLVLGVFALAMLFVYLPDTLESMLKVAASMRDYVVSLLQTSQQRTIARTALHESSLVLMFLTMLMRILFSLIEVLFNRIRDR